MTLSHAEFIRRFAQHILPKRFVKIRHYGFLSSTWKRQKLKKLQQNLKVKPAERASKSRHRKCPCCKVGNLVTIETFDNRGPPTWWKSSVSQIPVPHKSQIFVGRGRYVQIIVKQLKKNHLKCKQGSESKITALFHLNRGHENSIRKKRVWLALTATAG